MSDKVSLLKLAVQLRHAQFYAHMAHNLTCGPTFYQDHDAFGDLYKAYEGEYDAVIERFIGLGGSPSIYGVTKNALAMLEECQGDNKPSVFFITFDKVPFDGVNDYLWSHKEAITRPFWDVVANVSGAAAVMNSVIAVLPSIEAYDPA